jgi:hypothetical protein
VLRSCGQRVSLFGTFTAGMIAGSTAAFLVTPADVIKTRLQGNERAHFKNIPTCVSLTLKEGPGAFFKGAMGRLLLIGPLFGIVLLTYEFLPAYVPL